MGQLTGMLQQNGTGEKGGLLEKESERGWGPVHKGRDWLTYTGAQRAHL